LDEEKGNLEEILEKPEEILEKFWVGVGLGE